MSGLRVLAGVVLALGLTGLVHAQEDRIRSEAGGLNRSPSYGMGSMTGKANDVFTIRNRNGAVVYQMTVSEWATSLWVPEYNPIEDTIEHRASQQTTVRLRYWVLTNRYPDIQGGTAEIRRGSEVLDTDRLY